MTSRSRFAAAVAAALGAAVLLGGCGGDETAANPETAPPAATTAARPAPAPSPVNLDRLQGDLAQPVVAAPALRLRTAQGRPFDLREVAGSPAVITFVYAGCIDVCPLIMQNLSSARRTLKGQGVNLRVVAVSVDPVGDSPRVVRSFLRDQGLTGDVTYLVGDTAQLRRTWAGWKVGARVDLTDPDLVEHSALVYGISSSGKLTTRYPVDVSPRTVVRDARLLARA